MSTKRAPRIILLALALFGAAALGLAAPTGVAAQAPDTSGVLAPAVPADSSQIGRIAAAGAGHATPKAGPVTRAPEPDALKALLLGALLAPLFLRWRSRDKDAAQQE